MKITFEKLGFCVIVHHNLFSFDIKGELKKLAAQNFSKHGCLVVCILSHGIENAIAGSDDHWVNINKLKYKFSYNKCPSLYGKPKIFIVQACQGSLEQTSTGVVPITISSTGTDFGCFYLLVNDNANDNEVLSACVYLNRYKCREHQRIYCSIECRIV